MFQKNNRAENLAELVEDTLSNVTQVEGLIALFLFPCH